MKECIRKKIYWQSDGGHSASVPVYLIQRKTAKGGEECPKCRPGQFFIFLVLRTTTFLWWWDSKMNIVIFSVKALNLRKVQACLTCSWDWSWTPNPKLWDHRKEPLCPAEIGFKCLSWKRIQCGYHTMAFKKEEVKLVIHDLCVNAPPLALIGSEKCSLFFQYFHSRGREWFYAVVLTPLYHTWTSALLNTCRRLSVMCKEEARCPHTPLPSCGLCLFIHILSHSFCNKQAHLNHCFPEFCETLWQSSETRGRGYGIYPFSQ